MSDDAGDPGDPVRPVGPDEVAAAHARIAGLIRRTPVLALDRDELGIPDGAAAPGVPVVAKLDLLQPTGSFKVRGAAALLTGVAVPAAGVVAASGGNFGLAVAWAAARLGHRATIVVPDTSPREKIDPIRALGATVEVVAGHYAQAFARAQELLADGDRLAAHAYDHPAVVAGQGTATVELLADAGGIDTVVVACGGGGLLAGAIAASPPEVRIVAVETEGTATLHRALEAGAPVDVEVSGLAASALGAPRIGALAWAARERITAAVVVTDDDVRRAQQQLWSTARLVAEPGGATALAALTSGAYVAAPDERVAVLVCGANTHPATVVGSPAT
ncbi:MAG: serine/threonine dehydratase [Nitriliruptoraceae bacterium]|nr:serine/threonine dehydratase [Nitriliruptoraceae bacterium]